MDRNQRVFIYHYNQPDDIPADFPNRYDVVVLKDSMYGNGGPLKRLIECRGARYVLLLEFNDSIADCLENKRLRKMYEGLEKDDGKILHDALKECMKLFWPFLKDDYNKRLESGMITKEIHPLDKGLSQSYKLQVKTVDGLLCAAEHSTELDFGCEPFEKPFEDIQSFPSCELEFVTKICSHIFKVKFQEQEYCLKALRFGSGRCLLDEIRKLYMIPNHSNVIRLCGVVENEEGKVVGMLMPFISGTTLAHVELITALQKEKWKKQISETVHFLHDLDFVWGDVKPHNIVINSVTDNPVLIDFEGGADVDWVDPNLMNTKEGDLQGLKRVLSYIEDMVETVVEV